MLSGQAMVRVMSGTIEGCFTALQSTFILAALVHMANSHVLEAPGFLQIPSSHTGDVGIDFV